MLVRCYEKLFLSSGGVSDPVLKKDTNYVGSSSEDDNMELDRVNLCCIPMNSSWRVSGRKETSGKLVRRDKQKTTGMLTYFQMAKIC